ncbi:MAG: hypothetical protein AMXMBFR58_05750 [Phycisphaerae bacterium]
MPMTGAIADPTGFDAKAQHALRRVRVAIADLIAPLTGKRTVKTADLVEMLGLDTRLAWKLTKILDDDDALTAVRYLPGRRAVRLLLKAAARRGAPRAALDELEEAFDALDELVQREAGDRKSFGMMVSNRARALRDDAALEHRKGAFDHNGFIWGVQAKLQVHTYFMRQSQDGEHLDAAIVRGFVGLRRVRPNVPWRVSRFVSIDDTNQVRGQFERSPIDPSGVHNCVPLLREYCSPEIPPVQRAIGPMDAVDYVLGQGEVGNTQSVTCLIGELIRNTDPCYPDEHHRGLGTKAPLRTPCQAVVFDLYLHRPFFGKVSPTCRLVSDLFVESVGVGYTDTDHLPLTETIDALGPAAVAPPVVEMPGYSTMMQSCFRRLGWEAAEFDCYRITMPYPPMPSALLVDCDLPRRP